ncbi:hypothetical protein V6N12_004007 [Hibiscus sabdariffa]|uniref:Fe2OG dioxygenase domain-containing protein n=1 Tax=Hibiscus sabdariffa TaxID=183260 RepID=A0ABR2CK59_9ROSI
MPIPNPKCPNPELTVGVGRHSDVSTLTILLQDEIGGLFVRQKDGDNWIHVPPIKGSLVINVGDALQIMSNGRYRSVEHRVVANGSNNRISVPIFVNPRPADVIGPLPELIASDSVQSNLLQDSIPEQLDSVPERSQQSSPTQKQGLQKDTQVTSSLPARPQRNKQLPQRFKDYQEEVYMELPPGFSSTASNLISTPLKPRSTTAFSSNTLIFFLKHYLLLSTRSLLESMAPTLAHPFLDSSALREFVINQGNGVKGLSELGLTALPKQYIQPLEERTCMSNIVPQESIPIIDMSNWEDPQVAKSICDAASKWGFFQIVNHDVPIEVLENVKDATYRFFRLPAEVKNKYSKEHSSSNNVRFGTSFTPQAEKALEWKDYLSLFYVSEEETSALWPSVCR